MAGQEHATLPEGQRAAFETLARALASNSFGKLAHEAREYLLARGWDDHSIQQHLEAIEG